MSGEKESNKRHEDGERCDAPLLQNSVVLGDLTRKEKPQFLHEATTREGDGGREEVE